MKKFVFVFLIISLQFFSQSLYFEHATIYYPAGYDELAKRVGMEFENIRKYVINLFKNDPGRVNIFIKTKTTITNGYANPVQKNTIVIYTWHPTGYLYNYLPFDDWYRYLLIHEFTHIVTLKPDEGYLKFLSQLSIPYYPDLGVFSVEAPTVFSESQFSENSGRLRNPLVSEALFDTFNGELPEDKIPNDFRVGQVFYNANGGFFEYLKEKYGMDKVNAYLKDALKRSYTYPELMLEFSIPYVFLFRVPTLLEDLFKKHFGSTYDEEVSNWLSNYVLRKGSKQIYIGENERIYKVEREKDKLYILKSSFGSVSGYLGYPLNKIIVLAGKKKVEEYNVSAVDFRVDNGKIYALVNSDKMEIWNVTDNKKLFEGFISAFDVENGNIIYAVYDDKYDSSKIFGLEKVFEVKGFVRNLVYNGKNLYYLVGNKLWKDDKLLDDYCLKGAFLKKQGEKIYVIMKQKGYMDLVDIDEKKKITEGLFAFDALVEGDGIIYIGYSQGGMNVYKEEKEILRRDVVFKKARKENMFKAKYKKSSFCEDKLYSITPSVFAPFAFTTYFVPNDTLEGWGVGAIFDFKPSVDSDLIFVPFYTDLKYTLELQRYEWIFKEYGMGFAYSFENDRVNFASFGVVKEKEPNVLGYSSFNWIPFVRKVSYDRTFYIQTSVEAYYDINGIFVNLTPNIGINAVDKNYGGYFTLSAMKNISYLLIGGYFLDIFNQKTYSYIDVNYDLNNIRYSVILISNIFPFYKQSGIGVGAIGKNDIPSFLGYIYLGMPDNNMLYLQGGLKFSEGKWGLFIGFGIKPHMITFAKDIL
ncbi:MULTISPECIES: hypothetical protein [unclassified Thermosipho (in: thermotogales)]|uniref:hypothetical protein n=1 Tax=unclassified Thermosipho (in: thermotogales) TaxID=2676525 RepID=UPI000986A51C|nr:MULTISPECIES: hypothetical protein [unclassified Thermosipho (in: thermotogales)]MBT1247964.1 hypothetical protein [Thermosipho sp. 1244]OOC46708.1 hypothetical protein XO09_05295 [Thermosipho sp. 1223]